MPKKKPKSSVTKNKKTKVNATVATVATHVINLTSPYMTKYEKCRILGTIAQQISMGAKAMVELEGETDPLKIAIKELDARRIPIIIRRGLPNGTFEEWNVCDLIPMVE